MRLEVLLAARKVLVPGEAPRLFLSIDFDTVCKRARSLPAQQYHRTGLTRARACVDKFTVGFLFFRCNGFVFDGCINPEARHNAGLRIPEQVRYTYSSRPMSPARFGGYR